MNYTENYHLPQWDETDHILRKDFNQMCADIEGGLTMTSQESNAISQGSNAQYEKSWSRTARLAYNHYCLIQDMETPPHQIGMFRQNPASDTEGFAGTTLWNGICFAGKDQEDISRETLDKCLETLTTLRMVKNDLAGSTPMTAILHAPVTGQWRNFILNGTFSDAIAKSTFQARFSVTNMLTGVEEQVEILEMSYVADAGILGYPFQEVMRFVSGVDYLITIQPLTANSTMDARFSISTANTAVTTAHPVAEAITAVHRFRELEPGQGGMAIVRCLMSGKGGNLSFQWDGIELSPDITRIARAGGRGWQEYIFLRDDVVPIDSEMSLRLESGETGAVLLYDWGAMLL